MYDEIDMRTLDEIVNIKTEVRIHMKKSLTLVGYICLVCVLVALPFIGACAPEEVVPPAEEEEAPPPPPPPKPETAEEFYGKNKVTVIVPYNLGGGTDFGARIFTSVWPEFVPGGTMVIKNMPGAGGVIGANYMYTAKPDGLTICVTTGSSGLSIPKVFNDPAAKYDPTKFEYLAAYGVNEMYLCLAPHVPIHSAEDLVGAEGLRWNTTGVYSDDGLRAAIASEILQLKDNRIVAGYAGSGEQYLSMGRGETDIKVVADYSIEPRIAQGYITAALLHFELERGKSYPDLPSLADLVTITDKQKDWFKLYRATADAKVVLMPPGCPQDRVDFMRDVFSKMLADKGVVKMMKKHFAIWTPPFSGNEYAKGLSDALNLPASLRTEIIERIDALAHK